MDLEKLATSAVSDSIAMTDTMSPFVNNGDKEPVWDGHVYIYANKRKKKENIKRVPVQVKGKKCDKQDTDRIKYPIEVAYLKDYLDDGGVMLFVVYISEDGARKQIFYSALLPIKLRLILSNIGTQKKKSIELRRFPDNNEDKTTIFLNFFNNMQKQTSFAHAELLSEEELVKQGLLEEITFSVTKYGDRPADISELLFQNDLYMYAKVKGSSIPQPLEAIPLNIHISEEVYSAVIVNGVKYYDSFKRIKTEMKVELIIGKSLFISFNKKEQNEKIQFKPTNVLKDALIDIPFILALIVNKQIEIGGTSLDFSKVQNIFTNERIETLRNNLDYYKRVSDLFECLRLDKDRDLSKMSPEDCRNTQRLYDAIIDDKPVSGLRGDIPHIVLLDYMDTKIALVFSPTDTAGEYLITDYFKDTSFEVYRLENDEKHPTSKYVKMTADNFLEIGNIDYDEIQNSFLQYADESYCFDEATLLLLEMILAYDKSNDERIDVLNQAERFALFLLTDVVSSKDKRIALLNYLQIEKRKHTLTADQENILVNIAESVTLENKNQEYALRLGANLLLNNQKTANYYYKLLDKNTQKLFRKYPIWRFWKKIEETS